MFKRIIFVFLLILASAANAQVNKYVEARGYGYVLDEKTLSDTSKSPIACDDKAANSTLANYAALYCINAKEADLRIGFEWKRSSLRMGDYAKHLGGTLLADIGSPTEGYIRWDSVDSFQSPVGIKGTLFDCTVKDGSKIYYLSFYVFSSKEDGRRNVIYVYSKTSDSKESEQTVRTAAQNLAKSLQPSAK